MEQRRRRRSWSDAEKQQIVSDARVPGSSVAEVARRHGANANIWFWLFGHAIAGVCESGVILFAASGGFRSVAVIADWAWVLARPKYRAR